METKIYTRRDSATSVLRKLGLKPRDYNYFIKQQDDGTYLLELGRAKAHLKSLTEPKPTAPKAKTERVTISSVARAAILDGKTNKEVFKILQAEFGADRINDDKRGYPSWYRAEMRRRGALPPAFDFTEKDQDHIRFVDGEE